MLISLAALSSCSSTSVSNPSPEPYYPSCSSVCIAAREDMPDDLWRDMKNMVVVMEQLRARQDGDEQQPFGDCRCGG